MQATDFILTDEVTEVERDESLRLFGHRPAEQGEATRWLQPWRRDTRRTPPEIEELPVYEEVFQELVEAMPIEKRLAGLAPEQVLREAGQLAHRGRARPAKANRPPQAECQ